MENEMKRKKNTKKLVHAIRLGLTINFPSTWMLNISFLSRFAFFLSFFPLLLLLHWNLFTVDKSNFLTMWPFRTCITISSDGLWLFNFVLTICSRFKGFYSSSFFSFRMLFGFKYVYVCIKCHWYNIYNFEITK